MLDTRKKIILKAIVEDYILTAEPVGSRTIAKKYSLGISSATIRNEMADLEEMGYIEQPHTSAGRVPSSKGYRYYVDNLMSEQFINVDICNFFAQLQNVELGNINDFMQKVAKIITDITNYPSIVTTPKHNIKKIKCLQVLPVSTDKGMLVLLCDNNFVENYLIDLPSDITRDELDIISHILTERLYGLALDDHNKSIVQDVEKEVWRYKTIWEQVYKVLSKHSVATTDRIIFEGAARILSQPEFQNVEKLAGLLQMLEKEDTLRNLLPNTQEIGTTVRIGEEIDLEAMNCCSLVVTNYQISDNDSGTIGIIGPTRMDYKTIFNLMDLIGANIRFILKG